MAIYLRPHTIEAAVAALAHRRLTVIAGGTDLHPAHVGRPPVDNVLDITAIPDLRGISDLGSCWRVGAATTWRDIIDADLPPLFDGLKLAAREVGGMQIQNSGTVAGNICNASPAADGVPMLLALRADVVLRNHAGARTLPLGEFVRGNRRTALAPDQIVEAILIPRPTHAASSHFIKLGARRYLVISIAMVAGVLEVDRGRIASACIAVGACSEVAQRVPALEARLAGRRLDDHLAAAIDDHDFDGLQPIDDVRGSAAYRRQVVAVLVRRLLMDLAENAARDADHG